MDKNISVELESKPDVPISVELESKPDVEHNISKAQHYLINLIGKPVSH